MQRILGLSALIIPIILIAIIGGEIYYLFLYKSVPVFNRGESLQTSSVPQITRQNLADELRVEYSQQNRLYATNSALVSAIRTEKYEGKITEIDTRKETEKSPDHFEYTVKLMIKGKGELQSQLFFSETELTFIKVVQKDNQQDTLIEFSDLKVGDEVILNLTRDLTKGISDNIVDGKITRF